MAKSKWFSFSIKIGIDCFVFQLSSFFPFKYSFYIHVLHYNRSRPIQNQCKAKSNDGLQNIVSLKENKATEVDLPHRLKIGSR